MCHREYFCQKKECSIDLHVKYVYKLFFPLFILFFINKIYLQTFFFFFFFFFIFFYFFFDESVY